MCMFFFSIAQHIRRSCALTLSNPRLKRKIITPSPPDSSLKIDPFCTDDPANSAARITYGKDTGIYPANSPPKSAERYARLYRDGVAPREIERGIANARIRA